jgi:hypothetical protein
MGDPGVSRPRRYLPLLFVFALHWGLVWILLLPSHVRRRSSATTDVTATLVLAARAAASEPAVEPTSQLQLARVPPLTPDSVSITYPAAEVSDEKQPPVDWQSEAHETAAAIAESLKDPAVVEDRRKTSSVAPGPHPWVPAPTHHAGEEYRTDTGEHVVWISDKCYVKSSLPVVPDLIPLHTLSTTVCPPNSGTARGDLFEALAAYKKLHPGSAQK